MPVAPRPNRPAEGAPEITGGETLTADTSGTTDDNGTENASFAYQWIANDGADVTDIQGAICATYTLADVDQGKTIKVRLSFTDDAGNDETLTSDLTAAVAGLPSLPLISSLNNAPNSHDGQNVFTFELRFSEELKPGFGYLTLKFHACQVTGGEIKRSRRLDRGSNIRWNIHVHPTGNAA